MFSSFDIKTSKSIVIRTYFKPKQKHMFTEQKGVEKYPRKPLKMPASYDVFILYSMKDAFFVGNLAKSLEKHNISVKYAQGSFQFQDIRKEFEEAFFGLVVISRDFIMEIKNYIDDLIPFLSTDIQMLHPIWFELSKSDIISIEPRLSICDSWGLEMPPETADSISQKIALKLAGSLTLQKKVFDQNQIQYLPPKICTFRSAAVSSSFEKRKEAYLEAVAHNKDFKALEMKVSVPEDEKTKNNGSQLENNGTSEIPLNTMSYEMREAISKRLDCYLTKLCNWKDLSEYFLMSDPSYLTYLYSTGQPTMSLLDELCLKGVTISEFKEACAKLQRYDVLDDMKRFEHNENNTEKIYIRD